MARPFDFGRYAPSAQDDGASVMETFTIVATDIDRQTDERYAAKTLFYSQSAQIES